MNKYLRLVLEMLGITTAIIFLSWLPSFTFSVPLVAPVMIKFLLFIVAVIVFFSLGMVDRPIANEDDRNNRAVIWVGRFIALLLFGFQLWFVSTTLGILLGSVVIGMLVIFLGPVSEKSDVAN